jgi:hypothetical protein
VSEGTASLFDSREDPKAKEAADKLRGLIGRRLESIEVVPLGVMFHFGPLSGDQGVVYWAYGGPK